MHPLAAPPRVQSLIDLLEVAEVRARRRRTPTLEDAQPVHTYYAVASDFHAGLAGELGRAALASVDRYTPRPGDFACMLSASGGDTGGASDSRDLEARVRDKLAREPIEDLRIDFEDGYGHRADDEEDADARRAGVEVARGLREGTLPRGIGLRIKPFLRGHRVRSMRTIDVFLGSLLEASGGKAPPRLVFTLAKASLPEQAALLAGVLEAWEERAGLAEGTLCLELQVEVPEAVIAPDGTCPLPGLVEAAGGRCIGVPFGVYDYTASCQVPPGHQHLLHPACDFARQVMRVALAGTGVWLSDGGTNVVPEPMARPAGAAAGDSTPEEREAVRRAWVLHARHVRHGLVHGWYQGWDVHPGQLPARFAAVYAFFREGLPEATRRLRRAAGTGASLADGVMDDAATVLALAGFCRRAVACGAATEDEVRGALG